MFQPSICLQVILQPIHHPSRQRPKHTIYWCDTVSLLESFDSITSEGAEFGCELWVVKETEISKYHLELFDVGIDHAG